MPTYLKMALIYKETDFSESVSTKNWDEISAENWDENEIKIHKGPQESIPKLRQKSASFYQAKRSSRVLKWTFTRNIICSPIHKREKKNLKQQIILTLTKK